MNRQDLRVTSCYGDISRVQRALAAALTRKVAFLANLRGNYRTLKGDQVLIHPSSVLHRKMHTCVVYNELVHTSNKFIRVVSDRFAGSTYIGLHISGCVRVLWVKNRYSNFTNRNWDGHFLANTLNTAIGEIPKSYSREYL